MNKMIEPLGAKPLPSFTLQGTTTFNVYNVEAPFVLHWLEWHAEIVSGGTYRSEKSWNQAVRLLEAAESVASIWPTNDEIRDRIVRKLGHARMKRSGR